MFDSLWKGEMLKIAAIALLLVTTLPQIASAAPAFPMKGMVTTTGTPFEASEDNIAADLIGYSKRPKPAAKSYHPLILNMVTVLAVVSPDQWIKKYAWMIRATRASGGEVQTTDRGHLQWLVHVEGADHVKAWMLSGAIYIPCLGGSLEYGGIKPPTKDCKR